MDPQVMQQAQAQVRDLIKRSGWILTPEETAGLALNDMGLGDFAAEGFAFVDLLRSPRVRVTLLVLLPHQSLPQHRHPPYERETGKEETLRVLWGHTKVYVAGPPNTTSWRIPAGKEAYYSARHEIALDAGQQTRVTPDIDHWFQAGPAGSVNLTFQNRVDETRNVFTDPRSLGCPIPLTD